MKTPFVALALLAGLPLCGLACAPAPAPPPAFAGAPVVPIPPEPVAAAPEEPAAEPAEPEPEPEAEVAEEELGNMWGDTLGEDFGAGGLGLTGTGTGGGGLGQGLGRIGGLGHGLGGTSPKVRAGAAVVTGILPAEAIRRVVQQRVGEIRRCYETALQSSGPDLAGKVAIRFTIGPRGDVISHQISDGIDPTLDACVGDVFARMQFPAPEGGGVVVVSYPLVFQQADAAPPSGTPPP